MENYQQNSDYGLDYEINQIQPNKNIKPIFFLSLFIIMLIIAMIFLLLILTEFGMQEEEIVHTTTPYDPVGYWSFNNQDDITKDDSGNNNYGMLYDDAQWNSKGYKGGGLELDGDGDYFGTDLYQSETQTVSIWFKNNERYSMPLVGTHIRDVNNKNFIIWVGGENGECGISIHCIDSWDPADICVGSFNDYLDGKWHHLALVSDMNNHKLYIDGNLQITYNGSILSKYRHFTIGVNCPDQLYDYFFNGLVDEFQVYDEPLSSNNIKELYGDSSINTETKITNPLYNIFIIGFIIMIFLALIFLIACIKTRDKNI